MNNIKLLIKQISCLEQTEKLHILNMLKSNNLPYTKNSNGYFFNLTRDNPIVYEKLVNCVKLINTNRELIKEMDAKREDTIKSYKQTIEQQIQKKIDYLKKVTRDKLVIKHGPTRLVIEQEYKPITDDPDTLIKRHHDSINKRYKFNKLYAKLNKRRTRIKNADYTDYECTEREGNDYNECEGYDNDDLEDNYDIVSDCDVRDDGGGNDGNDVDEHDIEEDFVDDYDNDENDENDGVDGDDGVDGRFSIKTIVDFYKRILEPMGIMFKEGNHDKLVFQEFVE
jgi:hypothetical protein